MVSHLTEDIKEYLLYSQKLDSKTQTLVARGLDYLISVLPEGRIDFGLEYDGWVTQYLSERFKTSKANLVFFVGEKTDLSALKLCENLGSLQFSPEQILYDGIDLVKMPKNSTLMFPQASVTLDSRRWMTTGNQMISYLLVTHRVNHPNVAFCLPDLSMIDSRIRRLGTLMIKRKELPSSDEYLFEVYEIKHSGVGEASLKFAGFIVEPNLPSKDLIKAYKHKDTIMWERLRKEYKKNLAKTIRKTGKGLSEKLKENFSSEVKKNS